MAIESLTIGYVTGNEEKFKTVSRILPEHNLVQLSPLVDEQLAAETVSLDRHRSRHVAEAKAFRDLSVVHSFAAGMLGAVEWWREHGRVDIDVSGGRHAALYSDCIQYLPGTDTVLEKPKTVDEWERQVLLQADQDIEICVAHTLVLLEGKYPYVSSGIRTRVWVKPLTRHDLPKLVEAMGWEKLMNTSGGLPLAAHEFFRKDLPLRVDYYPELLEPGSTIEERTRWDDIVKEKLPQYNVGAFPNILRGMLMKLLAKSI